MIGCLLLLWAGLVGAYGPRLWHLAAAGRTGLETSLLLAFSLLHLVFWLLGAYYVTVVAFYFVSGRPGGRAMTVRATASTDRGAVEAGAAPGMAEGPPPPGGGAGDCPGVAVLYTTCNDFQPQAALTCLEQDYPNSRLFLLDDSTRPECRQAVEAFCAAHPGEVTLVRRPTRQGFKPGNLNHALAGPAAAYAFFAVVDADERLPRDFLRRAMSRLRDSRLAFVQASHAPNPSQGSLFARDIAATILPFWQVHCRPRNRYGFVLYLGHGAVVRRSAWEAVGGFPEVVTEDLAFSALLLARGLRGLFLEDLVCHEDFPATYAAFRQQQERYVVGTTQVLRRFLGPLLRSRRATWTEKLDFLLWCAPLYVPALCLAFVALCTLGLAGAFGEWHAVSVSLLGRRLALPAVWIVDGRFAPLWSWDFQVVSIVGAFAPAFACLALGLKGRLRALKLLFLSTVPYLSLMVLAWRGLIQCLLGGGASWIPSGERGGAWSSPRGWEIGIGVVLAAASLVSLNIAFFAVSCCLLVGAGIEAFGWEGRFARLASAGSFALIVLQAAINVTLLWGSPGGLVPLVFSVHF